MTKAAKILHVSQPALSKQIKDLEQEIGSPLFIRGKSSLSLTEKGFLLQERASQILELSYKTLEEMQNDILAGPLYIGTGQKDNLVEIVKVMKLFNERYPFVKFHILSGDKETLLKQIDHGLLDFGLFIREYDISNYEGLALKSTNSLGILVPLNHSLAKKEMIDAVDLKDEKLIAARQALQDGEVPTFIQDQQIVAIFDLPENAKIMVKEKLGIALIPDTCYQDPDLTFIPLKNMPSYKWHIIWKKGNVSPIQKAFIELLKKYLKKNYETCSFRNFNHIKYLELLYKHPK